MLSILLAPTCGIARPCCFETTVRVDGFFSLFHFHPNTKESEQFVLPKNPPLKIHRHRGCVTLCVCARAIPLLLQGGHTQELGKTPDFGIIRKQGVVLALHALHNGHVVRHVREGGRPRQGPHVTE